jgi:serine/threonine-protein kinase
MDPAAPRLDGYEIATSLGPELWLARRLADGVVVELRVCPIAGDDVDAICRFLDRGRVAGEIDHPGLTRVLHVDVAGDRSFVASELVEGVDVSRLAAGPRALPFSAAAAIGLACAEGLGALHRRHVAHGAVRAEHVIVSTAGRVALTGLTFGGDDGAADDLRALGALLDRLGGALAGVAGRIARGELTSAAAVAQAITRAVPPAPAPVLASLAARHLGLRPVRSGGALVPLVAVGGVALLALALVSWRMRARAASSGVPDAGITADATPAPDTLPAPAAPAPAGPTAEISAVLPDAGPSHAPAFAPAHRPKHRPVNWDPDSPLPPP